ncbi:MAG: DNA-binding transcriptional LysR family regulator [Paraglaciecola sp.]|jgi:DNA-binding transcriptional LysR family regulator
MTSAQLQAFITVARANSFTSAAILLGISQSAVSHAIKSLEEELGVSLFVRSKVEITLTAFGEKILSKAHQILGLYESIQQESQETKNLHTGVLKIASFGPSFSARILPIILKEYHRQYPNIKIHVEEAEDSVVKQLVANRKVDLGSIVLPDKNLDYVYLTSDQVCIILPKGHTLSKQQEIHIQDLAKFPFILTEGTSGNMVMELFKKSQLQPNIIYYNMQIMSMLGMVSHGAGISASAELSIPPLDAHGVPSFVVKPLNPELKREIGLAMHNIHTLSPAAKAFVKTSSRLEREGKLKFSDC